jgi:predicted nucleic acid-binding Zn ribbon protein
MSFRHRRGRHAGRSGPTRAGDVVASVLGKYGAGRELREHRVGTHWREIVGELVASRAWPDGLDSGVLFVRVKSSSWLHQLSFLKDEIIRRANQLVGDPPMVREVRFHLGPRKAKADDVLASTARIHRPPAEHRQPPPPAAGARLSSIHDEAGAVSDPELRELIVAFRRRWDL